MKLARCGRLFAVAMVFATASGIPADESRSAPAVRPTWTISHETTRITEPLTADGWPDYFGAINAQLGKGMTTENNAAVLFRRALGPAPGGEEISARSFEFLGMPRPPDDGRYFVEFHVWLASELPGGDADPQLAPALEQLAEAMARPWTAAQYPLVARWLNANEQPLAVVADGTARSEYFLPVVAAEESPSLIAAPLIGVQQYRSFARALCARAMLRTSSGERAAAWRDLLTCHRLARLVGRGATLIEALLAIAIDGTAVTADLAFIEHSQPDAATIRAYLADLEQLPPLPSMADRIDVAERYALLDSILLLARGDEDTMELIDAESVAGRLLARLSLNAIDWDVILRMGNDAFDRIVAALRKPDRRERNVALAAALEHVEQLLQEADDADALQKLAATAKNPREAVSQLIARRVLALLLPAITQVVKAEDLANQRVRNLRAALALAAHRHDHGQYPEQLDALSPAYLPRIPLDVFTGRPLVYRRMDRGYLLYSIGPNASDDGGRDSKSDRTSDDLPVRVK